MKRPLRLLEQTAQWIFFAVSTVFSASLWWTLAGGVFYLQVCYILTVAAMQASALTFWVEGAKVRGLRGSWSKRLIALVCVAFSLLGPAIERIAQVNETAAQVESAGFRASSLESALADAKEELVAKKAYAGTLADRLSKQDIEESTKAMRDEIGKTDAKMAELRTRIEEIEKDLEYELTQATKGSSSRSSLSAIDSVALIFQMPSQTFIVLLLFGMAVLSEIIMLALAWFVNRPVEVAPRDLYKGLGFLVIGQGSHIAGPEAALCGAVVPNAKKADRPVGVLCAACFTKLMEGVDDR